MICEECQGIRFVAPKGQKPYLGVWDSIPCPSCGGTGVSHCCEGPTGLSCDVGNEGTEVPRGTRTARGYAHRGQ